MSTDPVTITTTHDNVLFDPDDHRKAAAEQMGLAPSVIHCVLSGPDTVKVVKPEVFSEDGTLLKHRVLSYSRVTTWEPIPQPAQIDGPPEPEPEIYPWPTLSLPRGARWNGPVTLDGITTEENFISDGEKLVPLDGPEGQAVLRVLAEEHETHQAAIGG